jgi:hypothetical protein
MKQETKKKGDKKKETKRRQNQDIHTKKEKKKKKKIFKIEKKNGKFEYAASFVHLADLGSGRFALPNLIHFGVGDLLYRTSEWEIFSTEPLSGRSALPNL